MSEAPKKIFVPTRSVHMVDKDLKYFATIPYIRADLVDDLVEALEHTAELLECLGATALMARAALARVKEEG